MAAAKHQTEVRSNLRRIHADALAFSVMVGAGETYLAAFVLALGLGDLAAGLVASIPMLVGAIIQLVSPAAVRKMKSHRRWVVLCALTQAASFLPLIAAALIGSMHVLAVFAVAALYWGSGLATGAAWNTWVGTLVPRRIRPNYFARRGRAAHFAVLVGLVAAGLALQYGQSRDGALIAFAVLFTVASACRFISAWLLSRQTEPIPPSDDHRIVPMRELIGRFRHAHDGRLLIYMLALQTAVQISGPYFTPYMLSQLKLSYASYLLLIATSYTARIALLPMLGGLVQRIGAQRVLWYSGIGIIPLSAMWVMSDSLPYLIFVQFTAGAIWAAYELATFLLLFETIREEERTSVLTTFNLANAVAMVCGALMGGAMLSALGTNSSAYMVIFAASGVGRLAAVPLLVRAMRAVPLHMPTKQVPVPTNVMAVRPNLGSIERPLLPGIAALKEELPDAVPIDLEDEPEVASPTTSSV